MYMRAATMVTRGVMHKREMAQKTTRQDSKGIERAAGRMPHRAQPENA